MSQTDTLSTGGEGEKVHAAGEGVEYSETVEEMYTPYTGGGVSWENGGKTEGRGLGRRCEWDIVQNLQKPLL